MPPSIFDKNLYLKNIRHERVSMGGKHWEFTRDSLACELWWRSRLEVVTSIEMLESCSLRLNTFCLFFWAGLLVFLFSLACVPQPTKSANEDGLKEPSFASISSGVFQAKDAVGRDDNFIYFLDEGYYFVITLNDGTQWEIARPFLNSVKAWRKGDRISISFHDWQAKEPFRVSNQNRKNPWGNPEEVWGRPNGGLEAFAKFPSKACLKLDPVLNSDDKFRTDSVLLLSPQGKALTSAIGRDDCLYLIRQEDQSFSIAIWNVSDSTKYQIFPAALSALD